LPKHKQMKFWAPPPPKNQEMGPLDSFD